MERRNEWSEEQCARFDRDAEKMLERFYLPPGHPRPSTIFKKGDLVRVDLAQESKNKNKIMMSELNHKWYEVRRVNEIPFIESACTVHLKELGGEDVSWNWSWFHFSAHIPVEHRVGEGSFTWLDRPDLPHWKGGTTS